MAGLSPLETATIEDSPRGGVFGATAREQYSAILTLRWQLLVNSLRSSKGVFELGAKVFAIVIYSSLGLMMAVGFGFGSFAMASNHEWRILPILFWAVFFIWQGFPILLASFQQQFDLSILLRFPIRFGSYAMLSLLFGISDISTIFGSLCLVGLWLGISLAQPSIVLYLAGLMLLFALFNLLLVRAIFSWVDRWMAQRRTREIVTALFFVAMLSLQLLNPAWRTQRENDRPNPSAAISHGVPRWVRTAANYERWLPPGAIGHAVSMVASGRGSAMLDDGQPNASPVIASVPWIVVFSAYTLAIGFILLYRLRAEFRGENFSESAALRKAKLKPRANAEAMAAEPARLNAAQQKLPSGFNYGPIVAIMQKEFQTIIRSAPLLYSIGAPLFYCVLIAGSFFRHSQGPSAPVQLALPMCIAFTMLGFTNLLSNTLGTEGVGIQIYYLSPTPFRIVLLAKNLFYGGLLMVDVLLVGVLVSLRLGTPGPDAILVTVSWLLFALPTYLALGNILSLRMPYRMNLGRIGRRGQGSQTNAWLSLLSQMLVNGLGAAILIPALLTNHLWLASPVLLLMAFGAFFAWYGGLKSAEKTAYRQMDHLIATLAKTE